MQTYIKIGDGFISLNHYQDGDEVRLDEKQAKYLVLGGSLRVKRPQEVKQEVKQDKK